MRAVPVAWIGLVLGALLAGASFVGVLVARRRAEPIVALIGVASFGLSAYALVLIADIHERLDAVLYAFAFMVAASAGGWSLASTLLERLAKKPSELRVPERLPDDPGRAAVVLTACVEPEEYDPPTTAGMLQALSDEELLEPSIGTLPFLFFAQKTRYRAIGGTSPGAKQLSVIAEELEARMDDTVVDHATCTGERRLAARVRDAALAGHRTIVVVQLAVAESLHLSAAKREADALRLDAVGVNLVYADPPEASDRMISMLARRVLASTGDAEGTGVVLVGHGQPEPRARRNPLFDEQETRFLSRLRMKLVDEGLPENNVRIAWAEWSAPDVTSSVRHLAALGCTRVIVVPGVFPLDTIAIKLDLEIAVRQARIDEGILVVTLPAWRDDTSVLDELAAMTVSALRSAAT